LKPRVGENYFIVLKFAFELPNLRHLRLKFWENLDGSWVRNNKRRASNKRRVSFKRRGLKEFEIINAEALMRGNTVFAEIGLNM